MKPIYIEMNAFGSYQHEVIDFINAEHGLFLITGDTGAGKTTIFDAITYALFDKTSGGKRDGEMMRSQYASPDVKTQVKFEFLYNDSKYTITRSPRQDKWKKVMDDSGERFEKLKTQMLPEVELIMPDGAVYSGNKKDTDAKIREIIGLSVEQFTQIAMLAQGDFMKLLHASSEERKEIFAKIFDTQIYEQIEKEIYFRFKEISGQLIENRKDIVKELERVRTVDDSNYSEEWNGDKYKERFSESDKDSLLELVLNICKESEDKQKEISAKKKENDKELTKVSKKIDAATIVNKSFKDLEKWLEKLNTLEENSSYISELKSVVERGNRALLVEKFYNDFVTKQKEIAESEKRIEDLELEIAEKKSELANLKRLVDKAVKIYDENFPKLHTDITKIEESIDKYEKQDVLNIAQSNIATQISELEKDINRIETEKSECEKEREDLYEKFVSNQAAVLRAGLKVGEPCPVCGSTHHNISENIEHIMSEKNNSQEIVDGEDIKAVNEKFESLNKSVNAKKESLNNLKIEQSKNSADLDNLKQQLVYTDKKEADKKLKSLKEELSKIEKAKTESVKDYESAKESVDKKTGEYSQEKENLKRLHVTLLTAKDKYFESLKEQEFETEEAFKESVLKQSVIKDYQNEINTHITGLEVANNNIERLKNETAGKTVVDISELEELKEALENEKDGMEEEGNIIYNIASVNNVAYKKSCVFYKNREKIRAKEVLLRNLSDTAGGKISGKHINFQTYIQRRYFKRIINNANKRLYKMSGNQFILQCRDMDKLGSQGKVGLDLDVYSLVNEQSRDVRTLSGGESFMAALSMALGMADIIQNSAGNIHIDTMFIDEGFGSLSDDTRNQAIEILNELSEGKRLVGIISHVSELKAQVETKLEVIKTDRGSKARWN